MANLPSPFHQWRVHLDCAGDVAAAHAVAAVVCRIDPDLAAVAFSQARDAFGASL